MSNSKNIINTVVGLIILALLIAYGVYYSKNKKVEDPLSANSEQSDESALASATDPVNQMQVTRLVEGTGTKSVAVGDTVSVNYVGVFTDGKVFDQNVDPKTPFTFKLGTDPVIKGWELGLLGMKVGESRRLVIPPALAYGESGYATIPPNATLIFQVSIVNIK